MRTFNKCNDYILFSFHTHSVLSENIGRLKSSMVLTSLSSETSPLLYARSFLSSEMGMVVLSVLLLHFAGFFVG